MEKLRIIKRYPNRRLYDTHESSYVTLDDIKELVFKHIEFKVIDANTEENLTNYLLLQIISEHENSHFPIFTTAILENIIRFYGHPLQSTISQFLENYFSQLASQSANFQDSLNNNSLNLMSKLLKQNIDTWQSMFTSHTNKTKNKRKPQS